MRKIFLTCILIVFISFPVYSATPQLLTGGSSSDLTISEEYGFPVGRTINGYYASLQTTTEMRMPTAGKFSYFSVKITVAPGAGESRTFTIYKNGSSTAMSVTITETDVVGTYTGDITLAAGDVISLAQSGSAGATAAPDGGYWSIVFEPTTEGQTIFGSMMENINSDAYMSPYSGNGIEELTGEDAEQIIPCSGTLSNLYIQCEDDVGAGNTVDITVQVNGSNTSMTAQLSEGVLTASDLVNTANVSAGDDIRIFLDETGTMTTTDISVSMIFTPSIPGQFVFMSSSDSPMDNSTTEYFSLNTGDSSPSATVDRYVYLDSGTDYIFQFEAIYVQSNNSPGTGDSFVFTLVYNSDSYTATTLTTSLSESETTNNAVGYYTLVDADEYSTEINPSGTPVTNADPEVSYLLSSSPRKTTIGSATLNGASLN